MGWNAQLEQQMNDLNSWAEQEQRKEKQDSLPASLERSLELIYYFFACVLSGCFGVFFLVTSYNSFFYFLAGGILLISCPFFFEHLLELLKSQGAEQ